MAKQITDTTTCPSCGQKPIIRPAGTSKAGKPYPAFYSCPKLPNGSYCDFKWSKNGYAPDNGQAFNAGLDKDVKEEKQIKKDATITRLAIFKSVIEHHGLEFALAHKIDIQKAVDFCESGLPVKQADIAPSITEREDFNDAVNQIQ